MGIEYQVVELNDFSGGITDRPIDCAANRYAWADNFVILDNRTLSTRPGSGVWLGTAYNDLSLEDPQIPSGASSIRNLFSFVPGVVDEGLAGSPSPSPLLIAISGAQAYYPEFKFTDQTYTDVNFATPAIPTAPEWKSVYGINGNQIFYGADSTTKLCGVPYNYRLYLTQTNSETPKNPVSIFVETRTFNTVGTFPYIYPQAIEQKVVAENYGLPRPELDLYEGPGLVYDALKTPVVVTSGTTHKYVYAFVFARTTYFGPGIAELQMSEPYYITILAGAEINVGQSVTFKAASFPTLENSTLNRIAAKRITSSTSLYPINTQDRVLVYRTKDGGTVPFALKVWNEGADLVDQTADTTIDPEGGTFISNKNTNFFNEDQGDIWTYPQSLPSIGTTVENGEPPRARYLMQANDRMYYGNCARSYKNYAYPGNELVEIIDAEDFADVWTYGPLDKTEYVSNRVYQSKDGSPWAVPAQNYWDAPEEITGLGSFGSIPVAFCLNKTFRIDGAFDDLGRGIMTGVELSGTIGCIEHNSIVTTRSGIYFAGKDGFYMTDGYTVVRVSDFIDLYKSFITDGPGIPPSYTKKDYIQGVYDPIKNRVLWTIRYLSSENDYIVCLNLNQKDRGFFPFTTWSGLTNFSPLSLCYHRGQVLRGTAHGYVYYHDDSLTSDAVYTEGTVYTDWPEQAVMYEFQSPQLSIGGTSKRQWVSKALVSFKTDTNLSVLMQSKNDARGAWKDMKEIRLRDRAPGIVEKWRWFPAKSIRCAYKQLAIKNSNTVITNSDTMGLVTVNPLNQTALLNTSSYAGTSGVQEIPTGAVDDVNMTYQLSQTPISEDSVLVFIDGLCLRPNEYSVDLTLATITLITPLTFHQSIYVFYIPDTATDPVAVHEIPTGLTNGVNAAFEISYEPVPSESLLVFKAGQLETGWTISGTTVTLTTAPMPGQVISMFYFTAATNPLRFMHESVTAVEGTDKITPTHLPVAESTIVTIDGLVLSDNQWSIVGTDIVLSVTHQDENENTLPGLEAGQVLKVSYLYYLNTWPEGLIGHSIYFEEDNYFLGYEITNVTEDTITFVGDELSAPTGSQKFVVRGYPTDERFDLLSYVLYWLKGEDTQESYSAGEDGANA